MDINSYHEGEVYILKGIFTPQKLCFCGDPKFKPLQASLLRFLFNKPYPLIKRKGKIIPKEGLSPS
jgi:hypothetical protein